MQHQVPFTQALDPVNIGRNGIPVGDRQLRHVLPHLRVGHRNYIWGGREPQRAAVAVDSIVDNEYLAEHPVGVLGTFCVEPVFFETPQHVAHLDK